MRITKLACLSSLAVLAAAAPAFAQQVIEAPGVTIIFGAPPVLPQAAPELTAAQDPFPAIQQIDAEMNAQMAAMNQFIQSQQNLTTVPAAFASGNAAGVFVSTIVENGKSCTERVVYPGNGAAAKISVSDTGNACAALHIGGQPAPVALPTAPAQPTPAQTIQVRNETPQSPILLADRN